MSGMIKQLHNETGAFFVVQTFVNPVVPRFYYTSVYYLYIMDLKKGLRPVKLYELAELVVSFRSRLLEIVSLNLRRIVEAQHLRRLLTLDCSRVFFSSTSCGGSFCILFYKYNSETTENKYQWKICELLVSV
ncbi:hypothetical protein CAEBREN_13526 [Caenorhabditis brenneri]|uniref:Uncharacterized protein n=1 Tax=Caenorhabditis brenneri TaxID=135651 RepID=G0N5W3_CAEBE|nr:hypothetical protein CAEBREN_13526 [Caenorhabditis brenneri]